METISKNTKGEKFLGKYMEQVCPEAATRGVLQKKVFLEISQNSQENTCVRVSFLSKKRL